MKNWPKVDQLDDVEKPETLEYIRTKYGAYKIGMKRAKTFIYFKCPKNTCKFQMRLEKRFLIKNILFRKNILNFLTKNVLIF